MESNLLELTTDIVVAHVSVTEMSSEELAKDIKMVYSTLEELAKGETSISKAKTRGKKEALAVEEKPAVQVPAMSIEEAFQPDQVACMICGKSGMKTLKKHLAAAHGMKPGKYKKQFNVPKDQPLAATDYVAKRRQIALDRGLGDKLAAARAAKKAKQATE